MFRECNLGGKQLEIKVLEREEPEKGAQRVLD